MAVEDKAFPRGGTKTAGATGASKKSNLFNLKSKKKTKTKRKVKHHVVTGKAPRVTSLEDLSYRILTEGMLVLGRVTKITDYHLHVSLPGLVTGKVPVTQISEPYSQLLQSMSQNDDNIEALCPLSELFYKGQLVAAQVWQIRKTDDDRHTVILSLDPRVVHSAWSHTTMAKVGLIVTAAVKSKEEHGYVMECGVNGLRSFLKMEKASNYCSTFNEGRPLAVGQLVTSIVTKASSASTASSVELSADPEDIAQQEKSGYLSVDMQQILPGMRFKLSVSEPMREGVKVKFSNLSGFIHRNHIPDSRNDTQGPMPQLEQGTVLFGRVLYVLPILKHIYFSGLSNVCSILKEIPKPSAAETTFQVGDIVGSAMITGVSAKGIFLKLGKKTNVRGFVPDRRIGFNYKGKIEENDDETTMLQRLRNKFPLGSSVSCRLLHFDTMIETYVCSMEKSILNEKYLTLGDVSVGAVVPCIVEDVRDGGITVKVGMLNGFVPATHSADVPIHQPLKKFPPGTHVSGRVLKVDPENHLLLVTLKQSLVTSQDAILSSYQSARRGICYMGTVVAIVPKGAYISFYGGVRGFLEYTTSYVPDGHKCFVGQLLKCYVIKRNDKHIRLSLIPPSDFKLDFGACEAVLVGQSYNLEVVSVTTIGLSVKVIDKGWCQNANGLVPIHHLSDDSKLSRLLLDTFEIGTKLTNVWCFSNAVGKHTIVFSMRASVVQFFKSTQGKIANKKTLEAVCPGWILPCSINSIHPNFLLLEVPLSSMKDLVKVSRENVCENDETISNLGLVKGQGIQAKVLKVLADKNTLFLSCKKSQLWSGELETSVMQLSRYLSDQQRLLEYAGKFGKPIGAFSQGAEVSAVVSKRTEWGFIFSLANGVRGEATFYNSQTEQLEIGTQVKGKVLYVDCLRDHVELTLRKDIWSTLCKPDSSLSIEQDVQLRGPTLLVTPEFVMVQLKGAGKRNLAYIPTFLYPFAGGKLTIDEPFFGIDRKVIVKRCSNGTIVGLPKEVVVSQRKENKLKQRVEQKFSKRERYFSMKIPVEDVKKEEEDSSDELEEEKRILDHNNDIKIIDDVMDYISDEDSNDLSEGDAELEDELLSPRVSKMNDEEKENSSASSHKRKSSTSTDDSDLETSSKKAKQEHHSGIKESSKIKKIKDRPEMNSDDERCKMTEKLSKKKKKKCENVEDFIQLHNDSTPTSFLKQKDNESATHNEVPKKKKKTNGAASNEISDGKRGTKNVIEIDISTEDDDALCLDDHSDKRTIHEKQTLKTPGFLWDIDPAKFMQVLEPEKHEASSDDDPDESDDEKSKKKKRKKSAAERKEAARLEEERLQNVERELLDPNRQLSSCDDFDRMVLANPNSSSVWLQYMAFHLQATEIEKARAVALRAIKSISYREEQEKLNIWLGLLNLENLYGTPETLKMTLEQALQTSDPYKIRAHMVKLYAECGKIKELESEVRLVVKKFKETPGMWQEIGSILMNNGFVDKARSLMQQALPHMRNKKDSVGLVVQFALMEARNNNLEQAKALMDPILASYPQRVDVWSTYCDMLVAANQLEEARELLARSVSQALPARKMKTLFTKFLKFEEAHGSKEGQAKVRKMASAYVKGVAGDNGIEEI